MNKFMSVFCLVIAVGMAFAEGREEIVSERRQIGPSSGGLVAKPYTGKWIEVINTQKKIQSSLLSNTVEKIKIESALPVKFLEAKLENGKCGVDLALSTKKAGAAAVLVITQDEDKPSILCAPEDGWAVLNIAKLVSDFPSEKRLNERAQKEVWRAFMYSLGVGHSMYKPCLMKPVVDVNDLDRTPMLQPGPEPFNKAQDSALKFGASKLSFATYRTACKEGWAPAPIDNDQKEIWDEYKNPQKRFDKDFPELKK